MKKSFGFTLIELMITVAIISILAAIAYPNYQSSVIKSHRTNAMGDLISFQSAMERHYTTTTPNTYAGSNTGFTTSPSSGGGTAIYNLTIEAADNASFTLRASPTAAIQTGDGYLELLSTDERRWNKFGGGVVNSWN